MQLRNARALRSARRRPALVAAVAVLAAGPVLFGTVRAAIPDGTGTINGCYNNSGGSLRVIDTGDVPANCRANENSLHWSQTGPPGRDGTDGRDGRDGRDGVAGVSVKDAGKSVAPGRTETVAVQCPSPQKPLGGGFNNPGLQTVASYPDGDSWVVVARNANAFVPLTARAYAVCASVS